MITTIIDFFRSIIPNDYLTLYIISIIPIIELRGAILFMPGMFDEFLNMYVGMWCCIAGSTTVILPLILITRPLLRRLKNTKLFARFAKGLEANLADRAESAYSEQNEAKKENKGKRSRKPMSKDGKKFLGLFAFVAIPLPMTGAWTGSCIGSFLDFPVWKAALSVFFGNVVAGHILFLIAYYLPDQYADLFLYGFVILAIAIAVTLYFTRAKRQEKKRKNALAEYGNKDEYELALIKKEAAENGDAIIKKEYIDENGDKHIVIGRDESKNDTAIDNKDVI